MAERESSLAVLVDFENMARPGAKGRGDFDIHLVLDRLADKGRVLVKRAYADWNRYRDARHELQSAGLGLIEMPSAREGAKNRADIQMAVDAMEIAYSREHVDSFVIVSGDSDFTPLVGKLRELNKRVTGVGNRESASLLLVANCDEFIYYDNLVTAAKRSSARGGGDKDPIELVRATLEALQREGTEWPLASVVKDTMRRKYPAFGESDLGFSTFSKFLEDAARRGVLRLETDPRSGTYRVELADGDAAATPPPSAPPAEEPQSGAGDGRRRRRRRRGGSGSGDAATADADQSATTDLDIDTQDDAEVFEVVVSPRAQEPQPLPPIEEPISYEDMIMLAPDPAEDAVLLEASDRKDEGPPSRSSRRRRRRGATGDPEPTGADLEAMVAAEDDESPEDEGVAPATEAATAPTPVETDGSDTPSAAAESAPEAPAARRRVRRRSTPPAEEATPPVGSATPEAAGDETPTDAPSADAPRVDPALEAAAATAGRRRVRRRSAEPAPDATATPAEGDGEAAAEAPKPHPQAADDQGRRGGVGGRDGDPGRGRWRGRRGGAQARRRRRTTKAAAAEASADATATPAEGDGEAAAEAPKPTRRRRTTKAAAEASADATATPAEGDGEAAAEAPKPTRRRRTTKAAAAEASADATATPAEGDGEAAAEAPKPRRRRRTTKAAEPSDD